MYKKFRYLFRFITVFISKYRMGIFTSVVAISISLFLAPYIRKYLPVFRSTQRIAVIGRYSINDLPDFIQEQISIGLTSFDSTHLTSPAGAVSWEATESGKTYVFHLNRKLKWQDGKPFNSKDVVYHFRDSVVSTPTLSEFRITLPDPYTPFPVLVSQPLLRFVKSPGIFSRPRLVGLGNYRVTEYHNNGTFLESLTLTPVQQSTRMPVLKYYFYSSQQLARTAYKLGLVETISDLQEPGDLSQRPNSTISSHVSHDRYVAVFFNTQDPMLAGPSGKNLRMALAYAVNKDIWNNRAIGPIPPNTWSYNPDIKTYGQDMEKAKLLLQKVEKVPEKITLTTVPAYLKAVDSIKADWAELGINTEVKIVPDIPQNFQALLIAQAIPDDPDQYNLWHSTRSTTNLTQLKSPRIDKLLEDGRKTLATQERKEIYFDFQKYLLEECPAIFLFYPESYTVTRK